MKTLSFAPAPLPVEASFDTVVVGGGMAGVAAAVAAARHGAKTLLVERYCGVGGLATLGNVIVYLPLCDGRGRQVLAGMNEELLRLSESHYRRDTPAASFMRSPEAWRRKRASAAARAQHRWQTLMNPSEYALDLEKWVLDAGVELWYDTRFVDVVKKGARITHVVLANKDGLVAVAAKTVVDATGDADVVAAAGEPTVSLDTNVLCAWHYTLHDPNQPLGADIARKDATQLRINCMSHHFDPAAGRGDGAEGPFYRGDVAADVSRLVIGSHQMIRDSIAAQRRKSPKEDIQPFCIPYYPTFRMTRRLVGAYSITKADVHRWFDDAVCLGNHWAHRGPVWAIPYRTLHGVKTPNLGVCGRCFSVDTSAWDALRVIPDCVSTGEAIGTAAAAALAHKGDFGAVKPAALRATLAKAGNLLDPRLVTEGLGHDDAW